MTSLCNIELRNSQLSYTIQIACELLDHYRFPKEFDISDTDLLNLVDAFTDNDNAFLRKNPHIVRMLEYNYPTIRRFKWNNHNVIKLCDTEIIHLSDQEHINVYTKKPLKWRLKSMLNLNISIMTEFVRKDGYIVLDNVTEYYNEYADWLLHNKIVSVGSLVLPPLMPDEIMKIIKTFPFFGTNINMPPASSPLKSLEELYNLCISGGEGVKYFNARRQ